MQIKYKRKLSFNERSYLVIDNVNPPLYNQIIFEGKGVLDIAKWKKAVAAASEANPGSRVVLNGFLQFCRWTDSGVNPRVREVDGSRWDAASSDNIPFLDMGLCAFNGPACEVILIHGDTPRVAFRTHHAVMDGRGSVWWIRDIFRALKGGRCVGSDSPLIDTDIAFLFQKEGRTPPPHKFIAPTGIAESENSRIVWKRRHIKGGYKNFLAQVALQTAREARKYSDGEIRISIPVDFRPRMKDLRSTANLNNAIYIIIDPEKNSAEDIAADISRQLSEYKDCMIYSKEKLMYYMPLWLMNYMFEKVVKYKHAQGLYPFSGIITNLGKIDIKEYSGGGFTSETWFGFPVNQQLIPMFITLTGADNCADIALGLPYCLSTGGRLDSLMETIVNGIVPG